ILVALPTRDDDANQSGQAENRVRHAVSEFGRCRVSRLDRGPAGRIRSGVRRGTIVAYDVIVIGGGNAAMCSALSAREHGARVLVLEKAPEAWRGGNGFFTAGGFRFAFKSFEELCDLVGDLSDEEKASMEVDPYTEEQFYDDLMRVTEDCSDPDMAMQLVRESLPTVRWMRDRGVRWIPVFGRLAYKVARKSRFWRSRRGPRDAHALSRAQQGARARARHAVQHRRRHQDGAGHRRAAVGALERLPLRPVGPERAVARRPEGGRQLPEALVPARAHREPQGRALRGRGRRLPQLHLREVRARGHRTAPPHRVPDLRPEGPASAPRGI